MTRTNLLMGRFDTAERLVRGAVGDIVRATRDGRADELLFLARSDTGAEVERRVLEEVAGVGVPVARSEFDRPTGTTALVIDIPSDATPLRESGALPPALLRAGLTALLSVLSRAHSRGRVHGRIDRGCIVVGTDGRFWLVDWGAASRVADSPDRNDQFSDVATDVQALGSAFVRALLASPPRHGAREPLPGVVDLPGHGADRDFRRVLGRLVAPHPSDAYTSAGEVLADLDEPDTLDPWWLVPLVEPSGLLAEVAALIRDSTEAGSPDDESPEDGSKAGDQVASLAIEGPPGSGRSRVLEWLAAALRARGLVVVHAEAAGDGWGGVAEIVRQLAPMVGRETSVWNEHADVIQRLVAGESSPSESSFEEAVAAIAEIVVAAFAKGPGALLLDDVERLSPLAEEAWHAVARHVAARDVACLFVSTSVLPRRSHEGARVLLEEWDLAEVTRFLKGVLDDLSVAPALAAVVRRIAGGQPAEIVAMLSDLEVSGKMTRLGTRLRLDTPLHQLAAWSPNEHQDVRRALVAAGRDAADLTDLLAVAGDAVSRDDCVRLIDVPGPRLWSAAERAERGGLLRRHGARWRLRSERIRRRILASMSAAKRRSFHRELLELYRDRTPDDVSVLAYHARYAGHAQAGELTALAVDSCAATGLFDDAVTHLDEAETLLGEPEWGHATAHRRADLLFLAGRLGEAREQLERLIDDSASSHEDIARAAVVLAHVLYHSRDFDAVLEMELPEAFATSAQLSEIRFMRAASHAHLYQIPRAEREGRLAAAEWGAAAEPFEVEQARLEFEYKFAHREYGLAAARTALLSKMRKAARVGRREWIAFDLVRLSGAIAKLSGGTSTLSVLERAVQLLPESLQAYRHVRGAATMNSTLGRARLGSRWGDPDLLIQNLYEQTGASVLVTAGRTRRLQVRAARGQSSNRDFRELREIGERVPRASLSEILGWAHSFSTAAERLGLAAHVEATFDHVSRLEDRDGRITAIQLICVRSRMLWSDPPVPCDHPLTPAMVAAESRASSDRRVDEHRAARIGDPGQWRPSLSALCAAATIRNPGAARDAMPARQSVRDLFEMVLVEDVSAGELALAAALGIWRGHELSAAEWRVIRRVRTHYDGAIFPSLRWQMELLDCISHWRVGRLDAAGRSAARAFEAANWMCAERFGEWGRREQRFAIRTIREHAPHAVLSDSGIADRLLDAVACSSSVRSAPRVATDPRASGDSRAGAAIPETQFEDALGGENARLSLTVAARAAVLAFDWPGGATQIRAVAERVADRAVGPVTPDLLRECGLGPPADGAVATLDDPAIRTILVALDGTLPRSIAEVAEATSLARRTVQRKLRYLVEAGVLRRVGQGRSVRYTPEGASPPTQA